MKSVTFQMVLFNLIMWIPRRPSSTGPFGPPPTLRSDARPLSRLRARTRRAGVVAALVAPPDPDPPGPRRDARAARGRAAVPRRHRFRLLVPAPRRDGPRTGSGQAR